MTRRFSFIEGVSSPESCDHSSATMRKRLMVSKLAKPRVHFAHHFPVERNDAAVGDQRRAIGCFEAVLLAPILPEPQNSAKSARR